MPNYAVVIGINEYHESGRFGPLTRPVGDAIRMMEWLLAPGNAHGVAEDDLLLLLSPNDDEALGPIVDALPFLADRREAIGRRLDRLSALSNRRAAEFDQINRAVREVHGRAGDRGDRLYFYYSGHGLAAATDALGNDVEDAIVPADYDPTVPKPAISIPSITRTFLATSCREQFFFLDCCRNRLDREEIARVGRLSPHRGRIPTDQYIYNATALGLTALEGEGLFSDLLLKGLEGAGTAKVYAPQSGVYEVRAGRLFRHLREGFEGLSREAIVDGDGPRAQRPRLGGDHGGDPVLATLDDAPAVAFHVEPETPPDLARGAKAADVLVFGEGLAPEPPRDVLAGSPVAFALPPRFYLVQVVPEPGLEGPPPSVREIYDDPTRHQVKLTPASVGCARPAHAAAPIIAAPDAEGRLVVSAGDPLTPIELMDSSGSPIPGAVDLGRLERSGLAPGIYRARMRSPEGPTVERLIALAPGGDVPARLDEEAAAKPRLLYASGPPLQGIRLRISGEVIAPTPGRWIDEDLARRLATAEGVAAYLDALEVTMRPMDDRGGDPARPRRIGASARFERPLAPGPYWLTIAEPARRATTLATVVLEGRATELVVHQGADGRVDVSLSIPPARGGAPETSRMVGMLQRLVRDGDARMAIATGGRLLKSSPLDPTAGMIVGLLRLREGRLDALADVADRLVERFPGLPDAHALLGLLRMRGGDPTGAREAFRDSLARGLPMLAPLLSASADAAVALGIAAESPRAAMLCEVADALVPGLLWTAHRPLPAPSSR